MPNSFNSINLSLSLKNYYDLQLSNNNVDFIDCGAYNSSDLISCFSFNGENILLSEKKWDKYTLDKNICGPLHMDHDGYFALNQITGDTFCYDIEGNNFLGGFYQGYFKAEGYDYQVLPDVYLNGVAFEFWLKPFSGNTISCIDKLTLNEFNDNNKGFFFYFGLKEENPYCGKTVSGETCEGVPYVSAYKDETIYPWQTGNTFLYYTDENICNPPVYEEFFVYPDCCEGIECNALGVRLTDNGAFNVRYVGISGECIGNNYESNKVLFDHYSLSGLTSNVNWNHVVLKFSQTVSTGECDKFRKAQQMLLSIWVNGQNVYEIKVPELKPYGLNIHRSLQIGMPFNISVGGGTLGNIENEYLNHENNTVQGCSYSFCYNVINEQQFLSGFYIGENYFSTELKFDENLEEKLAQLFDGEVVVTTIQTSSNCTQYAISINTSKNLTSVKIGSDIINVKKEKCYKIVVNPACNHLAEYFAGSFEGQIDKFCIYDKALKVQEIRCLYNKNTKKYGMDDKLCCI